MEHRTDSPMAVKVEKHSQCIILTYFHGDINTMVDAHFSRALNNVCKDKVPAAKTKKIRKTIKLGEQTKPTGNTTEWLIPLIKPTRFLSLSPCRERQRLSGEHSRLFLHVTGASHGALPELKPCRRRSKLVALVICQSGRGPGAAIHHVFPVPRRIEPHWTAICNIPAQPPA